MAPLLLKSHGGSRESRHRGGGCGSLGRDQRGCPGWVWPIIPGLHPASLPRAFLQDDLRESSVLKAASQLLCIPGAECPHAKPGISPSCPIPPRPRVPVSPRSVHPCWQFSCTYSQWQGHGVLLYCAACCASPGCTSRKHRASHDHGTRLLPRCTPGASGERGPRRAGHATGAGG